MTTVSSSGATPVTATSKPWFLTFNPGSKDVLVWKNGLRMKLRDGSSSGPATAVSILSEQEKTVTLKGFSKDGSQRFRFHCHLSTFEKESNDFTKELGLYTTDPHQFCMHLEKASAGAITNESNEPTSSQLSKKRAHEDVTKATTSKKKKDQTQGGLTSETLQKEITEHQIGVFTLPVSTLRDPPPYLKVREVKLWYVDYLAKMLVEEDSDHEDLTAPLLVVASVSQSDFRQKNMNSYTYEVIGGIQRFNAISKVNGMDGARKISSRKCAVYGSGLSRSALLVLAKQHNEFNQIQRTTSFPEIAACCRRLLFSHFAQEAEVDDGDTMPEVPRYNTNAYREFKQECLQFLVSTQVSQPMVEQAIQMALLPAAVYHKMQSVFSRFEEGKLKGQKSRQMIGITLQKALEGKLAPKLSQFKVFQGLQDNEKEELLDKLLAGELSFSEVEKQSEERKALSITKEAFLEEMKMESWADVERAVPDFAKEEELKRFNLPKGKKTLPKAFMMFCEKARAAVCQQQSPQAEVLLTDGMIAVVAANTSQLVTINFGPIDMVLMDASNMFTIEEVESAIQGIALGLRQSASWSLAIYSLANGITVNDAEAGCNMAGAQCSRILTICSTVRTEGDVELASSKEVLVAWWGSTTPPRGHILAEDQYVNAVVCHPQDEDTMLCEEATGWMAYLLKHGVKKVADVYGTSGEVTQISRAMGIKCLCIQVSEEAALALADKLGLKEKPEDTEELLQELSEIEKMIPGKGERMKSTVTSRHVRSTRSKGTSLRWSKSLNPDQPIS